MRAARRSAIPIIVFLVGMAATMAAVLLVARIEAENQQTRFDGLVNGVIASIETRMLAQLTLLRGAAGLFNASDEVTREEFRDYVERLSLDRNYPGVLGIGYAAHAETRPDIASIAGDAGLKAWPAGERTSYSAILYLEPMSRLNEAALGFDMLSERTRRVAMEAARRSGSSHMSGKVRLVQEIEPVKQPGFLIYKPLYGPRDEFYGWVYSPLRAFDLFDATFSPGERGDVVIEIYDSAVDDERLLYRSGVPQAEPGFDAVRRPVIADHPWVVRVSSTPRFDGGSSLTGAPLVAVGGILISLLLGALMRQQVRAGERVERQVRLRTAELRRANERLVAEGAAREQAEAQMRQMQKMEAVGQLTGGIAHDFNNMLAVVLGNLDMAERRRNQPERLARALENARHGAIKAAELTQHLLAFARRQPLAVKVVDLNAQVADMTDLLRRTLGETIHLDPRLDAHLWPVQVDPTQLESAILNLAINARDAMPEGGTLTIATANLAGGPDRADQVSLSIRDTGHGMAPELAERAIEPFFTTKEVGKGTGLGLSQVYGFVTQSGGELRIESGPGEGTGIEIRLPRYSGTVVPEVMGAVPEEATPQVGGGELILVVEDEPRVREMTVESLIDLGYGVIAAASAEEALALLDDEDQVRLLFTDVVMPGMNGRELADAVRARAPGIKVLFTTGYARDAIVNEGRLEEGVALLQKPFTAAALARRVREELDG